MYQIFLLLLNTEVDREGAPEEEHPLLWYAARLTAVDLELRFKIFILLLCGRAFGVNDLL